MGGSSGGKQTTKVELPDYVSGPASAFTSRALKESKKPYVAYTGDRVADVNADETAAFDLSRSSVGNWQPALTKSEGLADLAGRQWSGDVASQYMNPYQKNVTDIAARELVKRNDIARRGLNADLVSSGAFGGAQHGVQAAEQERSLDQGLSDLYATGQAQAYDNAMNAFNSDRSAALGASNALGGIASAQSGLSGADVDRLMTSGAAQQSQQQAELDAAYQAWKEQQDHEWTQLQKGMGIVSAAPTGQTQTTSGGGADNTGAYVGAGASIAAAAIMVA